MIRVLAFGALIVAVGWWTAEGESAWHRSGASPAERTAAISACRSAGTSGLHGLVPGESRSLERCMTEHGWAPGAPPDQQVAALR